MAIQFINTGTAPNRGNGDTLRLAFTKINNNFAELHSSSFSDLAAIINTSTQVGIVVNFNTVTQSMSYIVNPVTSTIGKTITLASTSTSASYSDGSGIIVAGPAIPPSILYSSADDSWVLNKQLNVPELSNVNDAVRIVGVSTSSGLIADIGMYDGIANAWDTRMSISAAGLLTVDSINADRITGVNVYSTDILYQGDSYDGVVWSNTSLRTDGNVDGYREFVMKNHSTGTHASSDLVLGGNIGDELTNYVDVGFNGSGYLDPTYGIYTANSGYVFTNGGNLYLGTQTPGTTLYFHAGGTQLTDAGGSLNAYAWNFNRDVKVIVATAGPLNFEVKNTSNAAGASAVYIAENDASNRLTMGVNSSNNVDGPIGTGEAFIKTNGAGDTMHIGNQSTIHFYANAVDGYNAPPMLSLEHEGNVAILDANFLPYEHDQYNLGSATFNWKNLHLASTGTVFIGTATLSVNTLTSTLLFNNTPIVANTGNFAFNANLMQIPGDIVVTSSAYTHCAANTSTVIYSATSANVVSLKLFIQIEGDEDGDSSGWHTQAADMIVVKRLNTTTVQSTVFGRTYSSAAPLASVASQWNTSTNRIEITALPATTSTYVSAKVYVTELNTND